MVRQVDFGGQHTLLVVTEDAAGPSSAPAAASTGVHQPSKTLPHPQWYGARLVKQDKQQSLQMWAISGSSSSVRGMACRGFQRLQAAQTMCAEAVDGAFVGTDSAAPSQAEGSAPAANGILAGLLCLHFTTCAPCHLLAVLCAGCVLCISVSKKKCGSERRAAAYRVFLAAASVRVACLPQRFNVARSSSFGIRCHSGDCVPGIHFGS